MRRGSLRPRALLVVGLLLASVCTPYLCACGAKPAETELAILTGRLYSKTMTLGAGPVYSLRGAFTVPAGSELHIEAGVTFQAERNAELIVEGKLVAKGSNRKHIIFRPVGNHEPSWRGVTIRRAEGAQLALVEIRGATTGLAVHDTPGVELTDCKLERNDTGLCLKGDASCVIKNSVISSNKRGIVLSGGRIDVSSSSISGNHEIGIEADGARATLAKSVIASNRDAGVKISGESEFAVHDCWIEEHVYSIVVATSAHQDFSGNYWGSFETPRLRKTGARTNLPSVVDGLDQPGRGRVTLDGFLAKRPDECGASLERPLSDPVDEAPDRHRAPTYEKNTRVVFTTPSYIITDVRFREQFRKLLLAKNATEVAAYVRAGVAAKVEKDTFATVLAYADSMYQVEIIDGPHKGKQGLVWWQDIDESIRLDESDFLGKKFIWMENEPRDWRTLRLTSVITFLEEGRTGEGFSPDRAWKVTGGYLILHDSRYEKTLKITDRFTRARRENGRLILEGSSIYAHGDGTATLTESPEASEHRGPR